MLILDSTRLKILSHLAEKGAMNLRELSEAIGFYLSPTQYQVSRLHDEGLVEFKRGKWGSKNCQLTLSAVILIVANGLREDVVEKLAANWQALAAPIFSFWTYFKKQESSTPAYRILEDACREIVKQHENVLANKDFQDMILIRLVEEFFVLSPLKQGRLLPGYDSWLKAVQENPSTYNITRLLAAFHYLRKQRETQSAYDYLQKLMTAGDERGLIATQLEEARKLLDEADLPSMLFKISSYVK